MSNDNRNEDILKAVDALITMVNKFTREYDLAEGDKERQDCIFMLFHAMRHLPADILWRIEDPEEYELHWQAMVDLMSGEEDADGE